MGTAGLFPRRKSGRDVKLTTHLRLVMRSRKSRAISPLPNTPSWRGAQLKKHRDNCTSTCTYICIYRKTSLKVAMKFGEEWG